MITLKFDKSTPLGKVGGVIRFQNKLIYIQLNNNNKPVINAMKEKGADIEYSKDNKWIKIDLFKNQLTNEYKLGDYEFNDETPEKIVEINIAAFYQKEYTKQGYVTNLQND